MKVKEFLLKILLIVRALFVAHLISTDLDHGHLLLADCILNNPIAIGKIKHQLRDQSKQVMLYLFFVFHE